jgi:hypothetical protein
MTPKTTPTHAAASGQPLVKVKSSDLKPKAAPAAGGGKTKTEMILGLPSTLSPSEVVAELAKRGVKISRNLVYLARNGRPKKSGAAPGAAAAPKRRGRPSGATSAARGPGRPPKAAAAPARSSGGALSADQRELMKMILNVGLDAAEDVFGRVRALLG